MAQLVDYYHLQLSPNPGQLTLRQLLDVYEHPRDKDGRLIVPKRPLSKREQREQTKLPETMEEEIASWALVFEMLRKQPNGEQEVERAIGEIKKRWVHGKRIIRTTPVR